MYSLYKDFTDQKISLAYFGLFTDKITHMLIDLSRDYVSKSSVLKSIKNKTTYLIAESFQNLIRYGVFDKQSIQELRYNKDFFQISVLGDRILISSANVMLSKNVPKLQHHIDNINSLSSEELKDLKIKVLENGQFSEKGGAGLGMIEMVRKSGLPILAKFIPITEGYSLLIFNIEIPVNREVLEPKFNIHAIEKVYKKLVEDDIMILYKGDFSSTSNNNLIEVLENNFLQGDHIQSDKVKNIVAMIEVLQNVSKHGKEIDGHKEGIFALSFINQELFIECSNFVRNEDYEPLKLIFKEIKSKTIEEINATYKQKLKNSYLSDDDNAGLGLYEIARFTNNQFTYSFIETEDSEIYYSIKIKTI